MKVFDIGYQHGTAVVNMRTSDDLQEVWANILKGTKVVLWCDGLNVQKLAEEISDGDDDDIVPPKPKKKKKKKSDLDDTNQAVVEIVKELRELNSGYTPMQYKIWAEMVNGGLHTSMEETPTSTMFVRCGNGKTAKKNDTVSQAITQLASALSPQASRGSTRLEQALLVSLTAGLSVISS